MYFGGNSEISFCNPLNRNPLSWFPICTNSSYRFGTGIGLGFVSKSATGFVPKSEPKFVPDLEHARCHFGGHICVDFRLTILSIYSNNILIRPFFNWLLMNNGVATKIWPEQMNPTWSSKWTRWWTQTRTNHGTKFDTTFEPKLKQNLSPFLLQIWYTEWHQILNTISTKTSDRLLRGFW